VIFYHREAAVTAVRRSIQIAVLLLLPLLLGGALFEIVDPLDQVYEGGDDVVFTVLSAIAGLSLPLLAGCFRLMFGRSPASSLLSFVSLPQYVANFWAAAHPAPFTSPPVPLRI
jgi:hypothetical protein